MHVSSKTGHCELNVAAYCKEQLQLQQQLASWSHLVAEEKMPLRPSEKRLRTCSSKQKAPISRSH